MINLILDGVCVMSLTNEDIVTDILINREILKRDESAELLSGRHHYSTNPKYDLTRYLSTKNPEPSRFGAKYIFVK